MFPLKYPEILGGHMAHAANTMGRNEMMAESLSPFLKAFGVAVFALHSLSAWQASASDPQKPADYTGQHTREIKSLSPADIDALRKGQGWGLAKSAELNGYPGPLHVLQLADELGLTADQRAQVQAIYDAMKSDAQTVGEAYLRAERAVDDVFANRQATAELITKRTRAAAELRARLRSIHLNAHVATAPLLTPHQRTVYARLRGYSAASNRQHSGSHNGQFKGSHHGN